MADHTAEPGYMLNKQTFFDLIHIRYGWKLSQLPETCECGSMFNVDHALSCKKDGFVSLRHNQIRDITAKLLRKICYDVHVEPLLQVLTGEKFSNGTVLGDEARVDVSIRGFWMMGQMAFFDVR